MTGQARLPKLLLLAVGGFVILSSALLTSTPTGEAQDRDNRGDDVTIEWPSEQFPTLQSAVDAAPDGATLKIKPGLYQLTEPVFVRSKRLIIRGAGSGRKREDNLTHLAGPPPRPVVNERGEVVLHASMVQGLINLVAAEAAVEKMELSGFDAAIATHEASRMSNLRVDDVAISATGRGILGLARGKIVVKNSRLHGTSWHALSIGPLADHENSFTSLNVEVADSACAAGYFANTSAFLLNQIVENNKCGGFIAVKSSAVVVGSIIRNNNIAGILLKEPKGYVTISDNHISNTTPLVSDVWGDGIVLWGAGIQLLSQAVVNVVNNKIETSARAGISNFGATASLAFNKFVCTGGFDMQVENFALVEALLVDLGANGCGCPAANAACASTSTGGPQPPEPLSDDEP